MAGTRARGTVPTPAGLARRLVAGLGAGLGSGLGAGLGADLGAGVLDPACGSGNLLLAAREELGGAVPLFGLELAPAAADEARARLAGSVSIVQADALAARTDWPPDTAVVANPPWGSLSGRQAWSGERLPNARAGWPSVHGAFLERIARHVARWGRPARVLLPASVCALDGYAPLRAAVEELCALDGPPEELGESAFPGVLEPAVLLRLGPRRADAADGAPWLRAEHTELARRLERCARLPPACFGDPGVHTGNCAAELVRAADAERGPGRWEPLRAGRDLAPYRLGPPSLAVRVDLEPGDGRTFRVAPLERHAAVAVLVRQTADRPIAALHTEPCRFRNSLLACRPPAELDPAFVVAVLNGPVAAAWHRLRFADARQRRFPQVKVAHLRSQPFPLRARAEDPWLHDRLAALVRANRPELRGAIERLALAAFRLTSAEEQRVRALGR